MLQRLRTVISLIDRSLTSADAKALASANRQIRSCFDEVLRLLEARSHGDPQIASLVAKVRTAIGSERA
jgi:hypothetical protein